MGIRGPFGNAGGAGDCITMEDHTHGAHDYHRNLAQNGPVNTENAIKLLASSLGEDIGKAN